MFSYLERDSPFRRINHSRDFDGFYFETRSSKHKGKGIHQIPRVDASTYHSNSLLFRQTIYLLSKFRVTPPRKGEFFAGRDNIQACFEALGYLGGNAPYMRTCGKYHSLGLDLRRKCIDIFFNCYVQFLMDTKNFSQIFSYNLRVYIHNSDNLKTIFIKESSGYLTPYNTASINYNIYFVHQTFPLS